jgi:hypothetical protein
VVPVEDHRAVSSQNDLIGAEIAVDENIGRIEAHTPLPVRRVGEAINGDWFEAYVAQVLAPTLRAGDVMVMDNLSSHKRPWSGR